VSAGSYRSVWETCGSIVPVCQLGSSELRIRCPARLTRFRAAASAHVQVLHVLTYCSATKRGESTLRPTGLNVCSFAVWMIFSALRSSYRCQLLEPWVQPDPLYNGLLLFVVVLTPDLGPSRQPPTPGYSTTHLFEMARAPEQARPPGCHRDEIVHNSPADRVRLDERLV
jgi:hypothetical protein